MIHNTKAFTLVELIVVTTVILILGTIGFASFSNNIPDARDAERKTSLTKIKSSLKLYKQNRGSYPLPGDYFDITKGASTVAYQWVLNKSVPLSTLDALPLDPKIKIPYTYAVSENRKEFQVSGTLENSDMLKAVLVWDYKTVSKNILPSISVATQSNIDISTDTNKFIFDNGTHNLPYTFDIPYTPYSDLSNFNDLINDPDISLWQNSDYRSCDEILSASKSIWDGEYQIVDSNWIMTNTGCTGM